MIPDTEMTMESFYGEWEGKELWAYMMYLQFKTIASNCFLIWKLFFPFWNVFAYFLFFLF